MISGPGEALLMVNRSLVVGRFCTGGVHLKGGRRILENSKIEEWSYKNISELNLPPYLSFFSPLLFYDPPLTLEIYITYFANTVVLTSRHEVDRQFGHTITQKFSIKKIPNSLTPIQSYKLPNDYSSSYY